MYKGSNLTQSLLQWSENQVVEAPGSRAKKTFSLDFTQNGNVFRGTSNEAAELADGLVN